ncbi:MFS transporter [Rickettsia typhi]|uniref:Proline/betaine transporter ProP1 n=2 Tax=Rickettsia typhi TaxID=785 RepID=Q68XV1_RICTY|nr:MFS transporter [Rickettsia typhi]AAU03541.1 proline/betaine transporter ProP1 [Rickettsia typhi str. Wilmington]AFE53918.1 proline/betaine transporter ProP1 [Rickettsia typhi str. TH1527]AFE54756.1 proline/betaine transporter ProP1 [Rickettsia typhi str. B9991CWPP]
MNRSKLVFSSSIANTFEWYDYVLFSYFAPIIGAKFFPNDDVNTSLLHVFSVFAIGYLARPLGGIFFGVIGDRFGRKVALTSALFCMSAPTVLIGMLPTYNTIGITATIVMICVRILQGLSMGGALTGSISFVIEHTNHKYRGLICSISMSSICSGLLFGSIVFYIVKNILTAAQFDNFGWRIPFLIGFFIIFAAFYIKKNTHETPSFKHIRDQQQILQSPLRKVVINHWFDILISIFINAPGSIIFYLATIYLVSFFKIIRNFTENEVNNLASICYVIMIIVTLLSGYLSDIIGRKKIFLINLIIIIVTTPFLLRNFENGDFTSVIISQFILTILAASYIGPEPALQAEFYPTNIRNTALSISYNTATSIFGGTTPLIFEYLVQKTGHVTFTVFYVILSCIFALFALSFYKNRSLDKI